MSEQMRKAFEAFASELGHSVKRDEFLLGAPYMAVWTAGAWAAWRAALATQPQAPQGAVTNSWIDWNGGVYTGDATAMVKVKLRDESLSDGEARPAAEWCWAHSGEAPECDIVAYRILAPETPEGQK